MADGDAEIVRDRRRDFGDEVVRIRVLRVPESETFPEGIKYAFHYVGKTATFRFSGTTTITASTNDIAARNWRRSTFQEPGPCSDGSFANSPTTFHPDP